MAGDGSQQAQQQQQQQQQQGPAAQDAGQQQQQQQPAGGEQGPGSAFEVDYDKIADILDGRQKANEESVLKGYFKQQGLTGDEVAAAIKSFKDAKAAKAPDVEGMQGQIEGLKKQLMLAQVQNAVSAAAAQKGVEAAVVPYLARMADLTQVADEQGNVDPAKVAAAIDKVLDDLPMLKPTAQASKGFQVGGAGEGEGKPPKPDDAAIRKAFGL